MMLRVCSEGCLLQTAVTTETDFGGTDGRKRFFSLDRFLRDDLNIRIGVGRIGVEIGIIIEQAVKKVIATYPTIISHLDVMSIYSMEERCTNKTTRADIGSAILALSPFWHLGEVLAQKRPVSSLADAIGLGGSPEIVPLCIAFTWPGNRFT